MPTDTGSPSYGVDAPGTIRMFLGVGVALAAAGVAAIALDGGRWLAIAGGVVLALSLAPLGLGLAMIAYALAGKRRTRAWMLARHAWRGDEVVLDVGAGRGFLAVAAAKLVPLGRVVALDCWRAQDLSGNGPEALVANARLEGVDGRIEVVTGDARALDLADGSVDLVLSLLCLHNIEPAVDRDRALREMVRVLKPGGRALLADYTGAGQYARVLREAGLAVRGPVNGVRPALSLMALVQADKPAV